MNPDHHPTRILLIFLLLSSLLPAQQTPNPQTPPQPSLSAPTDVLPATLQARSDLVLVPVVVRDKQGKHIPGLTKDAFHIDENGKTQTISLFDEVQAANTPPSTPAPDLGYSNLPFDNAQQLRLTIIVLDLLNTTQLQRTDGKDQIIKFLSQGLTQNQPVSLLCLTMRGLELVHPFSTDTTVLLEALKKLPPGPERILPQKENTRDTLKQLSEIAHAYDGIPGRKTMIFAAGNIPDPEIEPAVYDSRIASMDSFQRTWKNLSDANIAVYPVQLMAWATMSPNSRSARAADATLREFAEATGGNRCIESNSLINCLAEAVEDSRSYYLLGFTVRPDDRKPGWRDLKVRVSVEHANVRARNGFYYGNFAPAGIQPTVHDAEVEALASSLAYAGVPMYVRVLPPEPASPAGTTSTPADNKKPVEFLITIPLTSIKIDPVSANPLDLDIAAIALTPDRKEAAELTQPLHGTPHSDLLQKLSREGIRLREKLDLLPGTYDVRVMVRDNNAAQIGTVVFPLEVK